MEPIDREPGRARPAGSAPPGLALVDLDPHDPRLIADVLAVLRQLRPHLTADALESVYREGHPQGLRFTAAYQDDACVGVAGWRVMSNTAAGRQLYVDDLVTAPESRSRGVGAALLSELTRRASEAGCTVLALESGVQRTGAHRFYLRERMSITSFHFTARLPAPAPSPAAPPPAP